MDTLLNLGLFIISIKYKYMRVFGLGCFELCNSKLKFCGPHWVAFCLALFTVMVSKTCFSKIWDMGMKTENRFHGVFSFQKQGLIAFWLLFHLCGTRWQYTVTTTTITSSTNSTYNRKRQKLLQAVGSIKKWKKLGTKMCGTVLRYWSHTTFFNFGFWVR